MTESSPRSRPGGIQPHSRSHPARTQPPSRSRLDEIQPDTGAQRAETVPAATARRPGRPAILDHEAVLDAAELLLHREGAGALTMRRLAQQLGVSPMALYRHVGSKDELLLSLIDRLAAQLVYPPLPADPRARIVVLWNTLYDGLATNPWLAEVLSRRRLMAPSVLGAVEEIHASLIAAGLELSEAVRAYRMIWEFTLGALLVRAGMKRERPSVQEALRGAPDPERYPTLAAAAARWRTAHGHDTYATDLQAILDALLASPTASGT
jgi:AcrR family transcriptional regulator